MATAPKTTRLADDKTQDKPQTTDALDAPADTYDPLERASSVQTDKAPAAAAGYLTVNAVEPVESAVFPTATGDGNRTETYTQYGPDGKPVQVKHDLNRGDTFPTQPGSGPGA